MHIKINELPFEKFDYFGEVRERPSYLSPTQLNIFEQSREEYWRRYLSGERVREQQTKAMAAGSAFDSFVKGAIRKTLGLGEDNAEELFERSVEAELRDWAWVAGKRIMDRYVHLGCFSDLMVELELADGEPRMEVEVRRTVKVAVSDSEIIEVPLLGRPDLFFKTGSGLRVIVDWKVNGYQSDGVISPLKGYLRLRGEGERNNGCCHKECVPMAVRGLFVNVAEKFENLSRDWTDQLVTYAILLDEEVIGDKGGSLVVGIDQVICKRNGDHGDVVRVACHRSKVGEGYFELILRRYALMWKDVTEGKVVDKETEELLKMPLAEEDRKMMEDLGGGGSYRRK